MTVPVWARTSPSKRSVCKLAVRVKDRHRKCEYTKTEMRVGTECLDFYNKVLFLITLKVSHRSFDPHHHPSRY